MNDQRLHLLLGLTAVVLCLSILSGISSFILSALYAIMAVMLTITAIAAIKTTVVAAKTAITEEIVTKEGKRKVEGKQAAVGMMLTGIGVAALSTFATVEMGIIGIFVIPILTALYLYNYKGEEVTINQINGEVTENDSVPVIKTLDTIKEIVSSALTDVNDKLLYGLGYDVIQFCQKQNENIQ